ncbi:MAG: hypothetical protein J6P77_04980 [Acetobacter sp.]|nr:hypothetical protein [Acetobacter sp.]MBO6085220.1 hypothetical protein [Acetobacter sp.]
MSYETRIYSKCLALEYDDIQNFYDKRAKDFSSGLLPMYTCTLLKDADLQHAEKWHLFEVNNIKPLLNGGNILDIGCGIGR